MNSMRKAESTLSISSIISDSSPGNDDPEIASKATFMQKRILEAISDINAENCTIGNEILELLNILKIDLKSLPIDIQEGLQTVTGILKSEGLNSLDETALQLCLEKKKIDRIMQERGERMFKALYNAAFSKYNALHGKLSRLQKEIEQTEEKLQSAGNDENAESNRILWSNKLHDYKEAIEKLEKELDALNIQEIKLDKTLEKEYLLVNKLSELHQLNKDLEQYGDLPPNLLQAKTVLECKIRELEEIEYLIQEKMNN